MAKFHDERILKIAIKVCEITASNIEWQLFHSPSDQWVGVLCVLQLKTQCCSCLIAWATERAGRSRSGARGCGVLSRNESWSWMWSFLREMRQMNAEWARITETVGDFPVKLAQTTGTASFRNRLRASKPSRYKNLRIDIPVNSA